MIKLGCENYGHPLKSLTLLPNTSSLPFGLLKLIRCPVLANISAVHIIASRLKLGRIPSGGCFQNHKLHCVSHYLIHICYAAGGHTSTLLMSIWTIREISRIQRFKKNSSTDSIFHVYNNYLSISWL